MENTPETPDETSDASIESPTDPSSETLSVKHKEKPKKLIVTPAMKADPISRKLIKFSLFFALLAMTCIGFLVHLHHQKKQAELPPVVEDTSKRSIQAITQNLDEIQVVLKNEQELRVEMVVECSQIEACDYIKDHTPQVRDLLIPVLNNINPNDLSSAESKNLVRKKLTDRLNTLDMVGKVIQVEFVNLTVEGDPK